MGWLSTRGRLALTLILVVLAVGLSASPGLAGQRRPPKRNLHLAPVTLPVVRTHPLPAIGDPRGSFSSRTVAAALSVANVAPTVAAPNQANTAPTVAGLSPAKTAAVVSPANTAPTLTAVGPANTAPTVTALSSATTAPAVSISAISATPCAKPVLDLKLLVLSADGTEVTLPLIRQTLDYLGTPYAVWIARQQPGALTEAVLAGGTDGCHGFYQGVILATGALSYTPDGGVTFASALSDAEWQTLTKFEANLKVRRVSWYTFPTAGYGYAPPTAAFDTTTTPVSATYTTAGATLFSYANTAQPLTIKGAWTYLAKPLDASTTTLLSDASGNAIVALRDYADGRQAISVTTASNPFLAHGLVLSYGLVNWVTRNVFLGQRRANLSAQIDDIMIEGDLWVGRPCETCAFFRLSGADFSQVVAWQANWQFATPQTAGLRLSWAFNGEGTTGIYSPDTLTPAIANDEFEFGWISHTFTHLNLDKASYATSLLELQQNHGVAQDIGLTKYSTLNLVQPDVSGLTNPEFLRAAKDFGVRYLVTDTSRPGMNNPTPNTGIYNSYQPLILEVPRHPVNLFYNVSTPTEWVSEYNFIYRAFWGRDLTYAEIVDNISDQLLFYLMRWDIDPLMFHQSNLRAYDGTHSLLGNLLEAVFAKYSALFSAPFESFGMDTIGNRTASRMTYNASGVSGSFTPGPGGTLTIRTVNAAVIPITGIQVPGSESYAGQTIANINLAAGGTFTTTLP